MESPQKLRMSTTTKLVLDVLLSLERSYGLEICQQAGLATGTVHPILARLEKARWVDSEWEDIDPHEAKRPARRYYRLTAAGAREATKVLAKSPVGRPASRIVLPLVGR